MNRTLISFLLKMCYLSAIFSIWDFLLCNLHESRLIWRKFSNCRSSCYSEQWQTRPQWLAVRGSRLSPGQMVRISRLINWIIYSILAGGPWQWFPTDQHRPSPGYSLSLPGKTFAFQWRERRGGRLPNLRDRRQHIVQGTERGLILVTGQAEDTWSVRRSYWLVRDLRISRFAETRGPWLADSQLSPSYTYTEWECWR